MGQKTGFFEENQGEFSMMRLVLFISVINAIVLTDSVVLIGLITSGVTSIGSLVGSAVALFTGLTSVIATLKLLQKDKENERSNRESGESPAERAGEASS